MNIPDSLKKVISSKVLKKAEDGSKVSGIKNLDTVSKNLSFLPNIARDLNVARQNIFKLVKLEGGKPTRASNISSDKANKAPTVFKDLTPTLKIPKKEKTAFDSGQEFASFFLDIISPKKILSKLSIGAIFMAAGIVTLFKDLFVSMAENLWDAIKESFSNFTEYLGKWFKDVVKPILTELTKFMEKIWGNIKDFFKPIFDWVNEKITYILEFLEPVFNFIGDVFGKVMVVVNQFKEKLSFLTDTYNSLQQQIANAKKTLQNATGPTNEVQYDQMGNVVSDSGAAAAAEEQARKKKEAEAAAAAEKKKRDDAAAAQAAANNYENEKRRKTTPVSAPPNVVPSNFGNVVNPYEGQTKTPSQTNAGRGGQGGPSAADIAKKDLTPSQLKWLGNADPTDPYIMARMPPPQPGEKGGPPLTAPSAAPALPSGIMAPKPSAAPEPKPAPTPTPTPAPAPTKTLTTPVEKKPEGISTGGKFSNENSFVAALKPWAEYVSKAIGGKVPPFAILGQWAGESGVGKSLPADYNYAGIKAGTKFQKGDFVLTEERYTDKQLEAAKKSGEDLERVLGPDDKMKKSGGRLVTVDEWYGKGTWQKTKDEGKNWVQVRSYFAKFRDLKDFADSFAGFLMSPRYSKAREQTTAAGFGFEIAKAGYATASAEKYSKKVASFDAKYSDTGAQVASASTDVAVGQRAQQKPNTPIVVDASTTNNTKIANNTSSSYKDTKQDTNKKLLERVT